MKNMIKFIGLLTLIIFSFFYTDKVLKVIREEDSIMIKLNSIKQLNKVDAINTKIMNDEMIPGISGKEINIDKSYKKMKKRGYFNHEDIIFDVINPTISMIDNKDKYIRKGNPNKQMVSIIFVITNNKYLSEIESILDKKDVTANYFIHHTYLMNHTTKIKEMSNREFYNYGDNGIYTPDNLLFSNNLISRISNHDAIYCLTLIKNSKTLDICSKNNLYTIYPQIIVEKNPYLEVINNLSSGSIIFLKMNSNTIRELELIIEYIKGKGLKIVGLSELLTE